MQFLKKLKNSGGISLYSPKKKSFIKNKKKKNVDK